MIKYLNETDYEKYTRALCEYNSTESRLAYVLTFGCQQNEADSEAIRGIAIDCGYGITEDPSCADLIIVNTCAIRAHAEMKALSTVGKFKAYKAQKPSLVIGICGCMAQEAVAVEKIKKSFHYVNFTLEPNKLYMLPELILSSVTDGRRRHIIGEDTGDIVEGVPKARKDSKRAYVSVMYGCNNFCSYCIVPYVRGRERSRGSAEIIAECEALIKEGKREITLLGQNVNSYLSDMNFATLLERIARIEGEFKIKFMTSHPKDASEELISVMQRYPDKIPACFHLPLQSGSSRILHLMNRTYDRERYLSVVRMIREKIPDVVLSTDVIVGFPDESDEDFEMTLDLLSEVEFDLVYSFIYSPREGTRAKKMENQVPKDKKDERMARLLDLQRDISHKRNQRFVGRTLSVLVDGVSKKGNHSTYTGRTDTGKLVHFEANENLSGETVNIKITRAGAFDLFGEVEGDV